MNESLIPKRISLCYFQMETENVISEHLQLIQFLHFRFLFRTNGTLMISLICTKKPLNTSKLINKLNSIIVKCIYRSSTLFCVLALNYSIKM